MTGREILIKKKEIENRLAYSLSTMEKKETIRELREELHELQKVCPHLDKELNFELEKGNCPYCGGKILNG